MWGGGWGSAGRDSVALKSTEGARGRGTEVSTAARVDLGSP